MAVGWGVEDGGVWSEGKEEKRAEEECEGHVEEGMWKEMRRGCA